MREAVPLRRELGAAREDPGDADLPDGGAHRLEPQRKRLEQLRRREHAPDVVAGLQDRHGLVDDVILVGLEMLAPSLLDQLDHPPRVEIDAEADAAAAKLRQVLDRQAQPPGPRRPEHQPVRPPGEILVRQRRAEQLVVGAEVGAGDACLRGAGGAARFEDIDRLIAKPARHPPPHGPAAEPLVLERPQAPKIGERADLAARIPSELRGKLEPEGTAGGGIEMPVDDVAHLRIEGGAPRLDLRVARGRRGLRNLHAGAEV